MPIGYVKNYREAYDLFACNGILFNHESPLRGETFVTRKITMAVVRIAMGLQQKLYLGNLDVKFGGMQKDYVEMMWMILQADNAENWVIATGKTTSIRDFVIMAFKEIGVELEFLGSGIGEKAIVTKSSNKKYNIRVGSEVVGVDPRYFRPTSGLIDW